jgi:hypothetical protein
MKPRRRNGEREEWMSRGEPGRPDDSWSDSARLHPAYLPYLISACAEVVEMQLGAHQAHAAA